MAGCDDVSKTNCEESTAIRRVVGAAQGGHIRRQNCAHLGREFVYRLLNPLIVAYRMRQFMKLQQSLSQDEKLKRARKELHREGIVVLDGYLSQEQLREIQADFERFIQKVEASEPGPMKMTPDGGALHPSIPYADEGYSADAIMTLSNNPFKHSAGFLQLALDPFILEIIAGYRYPKQSLILGGLWQCPLTSTPLNDLDDLFYAEQVGIAYPVLRGIPLLSAEHGVLASQINAGSELSKDKPVWGSLLEA